MDHGDSKALKSTSQMNIWLTWHFKCPARWEEYTEAHIHVALPNGYVSNWMWQIMCKLWLFDIIYVIDSIIVLILQSSAFLRVFCRFKLS